MKRIVKRLIVLVVMLYITSCMKKSDENADLATKYVGINHTNTNKLKYLGENRYIDTTLAWYGEGSGMEGVTHTNPFEYKVEIEGIKEDQINVEIKQGDEVVDIVNRIENTPKGVAIYIRASAKMDKGKVTYNVDRWKDTIKTQEYTINISNTSNTSASSVTETGSVTNVTINLIVKENTNPKAFLVFGTYARDYWAYRSEREKAPWRQKYWENMRAIPYYGWDDSVYITIQYPYEDIKQNDADNIYGDEVDFYIENPKNGEMVYLNDYFKAGASEGFEWYFIMVGDYYSLNTYCPQFKYAVGDKYPKVKEMSMNYLYNVLGESTREAEDAMIFFHIIAKDKYGGVSDYWISNTERGSNQDQFCIYNGKFIRRSLQPKYYLGGWLNSSLDDREVRGYPRGKDIENIKYWHTHSYNFKNKYRGYAYVKNGEIYDKPKAYSRDNNNKIKSLIVNLKENKNLEK